MLLNELLSRVADVELSSPTPIPDIEVSGVVHDSRAVVPGALFCCVPGRHFDGHDLARDAVAAGASSLLVERVLALDVPQVLTSDVRQAMGPVAAAFWGHPSRDLHIVGVTGTSGKTTTTHLLRSILQWAGWSTGLLGTLSGPRTTPEAPELQAFLAAERDAGRQAVTMEVSSHALAEGRVRATRFEVAVFTNLSHDHLDYHADMESYFEAKAALFTPAYSDAAIVNVDDERGRELARRALVPTEGYSLTDATDVEIGPKVCRFGWRGERVQLQMGGRFNVANALAAATAAARLGLDAATTARGLSEAEPVPGRFEPVDVGQPFAVIVDYSHKPAALEGALATGREAAGGGRVILVLGAGGDRDQTKRAEMGEVAGRLADRVVLTSDNPRGEDPLAIIDAIRSGLPEGVTCSVEPDRERAIMAAVSEARPGDVVLVAGKGHETYQEIGDDRIPFDDREVARAALISRREGPGW